MDTKDIVVDFFAKFATAIIVVLVLALIALGISPFFARTVKQGVIGIHRGYANNIIGKYEPGLHIINPLHRVEKVDNHMHVIHLAEPNGEAFLDYQKTGTINGISQEMIANTLSCSVKGQQTAYIAVSIGYVFDTEEYIKLRHRVAKDVESIIIRPFATDAVKSVASRFSANQLVTMRDEFEKELNEAIIPSLKEQGVAVQYIAIDGIFYTATFEGSLQRKALAEQEMKKNTLQAIQAEQQARLAEVKAVGESAAKSLKEVATSRGELIKKQAEADAEQATLSAKAQASEMLAKAISPELNSYNTVEAWNGKVPNEVFLPNNTLKMFFGNEKNNSTQEQVDANSIN